MKDFIQKLEVNMEALASKANMLKSEEAMYENP